MPETFESSEVDEKRHLLDLVFQNLQLEDAGLSFSVREPFLTMLHFKNRPKGWGRLDLNQRPAGYESAALTIELLPQMRKRES